MKVLFVSRGRSGKVSPLVENQAKSLESEGLNLSFFLVKGGFLGYLISIVKLRKHLTYNNYDVVHAHYSYSAFVATLAGANPLVVSLLGSDAYKGSGISFITRCLSNRSWAATIVKTLDMQQRLGLNKARIIPNGVNVERFRPIPRDEARQRLGYSKKSKLVVFVADPARNEKNFSLAVTSVNEANKMCEFTIELMPVYNIPNEEIPYYMNAADAFLLTSNREGGVNVVKEAMACNIPVVATDVGDVRKNIEQVNGCYVCEHDSKPISNAIVDAIRIGKSNGRERLFELGLDSKTTAMKIIEIYEKVQFG